MKVSKASSLSLLFLHFVYFLANAAKHPDIINSLPGLPYSPTFQQYSGYLQGTKSNKLHYWFVESQYQPKTDPVVLWLNGGPGCSSLDGLLSENGPFGVNVNANALYYRNTSWNKFANILYLESPPGVGYSYNSQSKYNWDDDKVAENNHEAIRSFYKKFPHYAKNKFYITGESYAGVYIPTLIKRLMNDTIPLQAFAIGNGFLSAELNSNSLMYFSYYHGIIGENLWSQLQRYCCSKNSCNFYNSTISKCQKALAEVAVILHNHLNLYYIYGDCSGVSAKYLESKNVLDNWLKKTFTMATPTPPVLPCINATAETFYLSRKDVRQALNIPTFLPAWQQCNASINANYKRTYRFSIDLFPTILKKFRGLIYNGDADMICNFLGDQWAIDSLHRKVRQAREPWFYQDFNGNQIGGYVMRYDKIDFLTVRGAGHMVPAIKPQQAYQMMYNFIHMKPYSSKPDIM